MEETIKSDNLNVDSQLTTNPIHLQKIINYFNAFNEKNLEKLGKLYSDTVSLSDWTGIYNGKEEVLKINQSLFESQPTLSIELNRIDTKSNTSYCYISIVLEDTKLEVLDCIGFNEEGNISSIEAILRDSSSKR